MNSAFPPSEAGVQTEEFPIHTYSEAPGFQPASCSKNRVNVGFFERVFSAAAGAGLAAYGLGNAKRGGLVLGALGGALAYRGLTGHCSCYSALGLDTARHNDATVIPSGQGDKVEKSVVINRPAAELYSFWREVENLPKIMQHLEKVESIDRQKSHWTACGPLGKRVEWDAEIFNDRENEAIAWRSLEGSQVDTSGSVHFKPLGHDRGTAVTVSLKYNPPAGKVGAWVATLLGENPAQIIAEDLRRFKRFMETGEFPVAGEVSGRSSASSADRKQPEPVLVQSQPGALDAAYGEPT
jgi:uncharacterized membrane protein